MLVPTVSLSGPSSWNTSHVEGHMTLSIPLLGFPVSPSHKGLLSSHTLKSSSCYELPSSPVLCELLAHSITQHSIAGIGKLPIKLQTVDIFSFSIYMVSAAITHSCRCGGKTSIDNMSMDENGCVSIKHYWQKQVMGWIWSTDEFVCCSTSLSSNRM